jgi:uroporphyrinogen decarboxylase
MDKLCRLDGASLREYVRQILKACMPGGRYAAGTANTVTNYTPLDNYSIMLEEIRRW